MPKKKNKEHVSIMVLVSIVFVCDYIYKTQFAVTMNNSCFDEVLPHSIFYQLFTRKKPRQFMLKLLHQSLVAITIDN